MWFAALAGDCRSSPWFLRFEQRLLEGSPAVLGSAGGKPVSGSAAALRRAGLYFYKFTQGGSRGLVVARRQGTVLPACESGLFQIGW